MVKVSREMLEAWLVLLDGCSQIPLALKELLPEADFTDVFPERSVFLEWYQRLPAELRLPVFSLMAQEQRQRLFDGEGVLAFFKAFHTPAEAFRLIESGVLGYDHRLSEPQNLADWCGFFSGMQARFLKAIESHLASVFRVASFSDFLECLSGNTMLSIFYFNWLVYIKIPGDPDVILRHFEWSSYDWWTIQGLFLTQKWPGYSEESIGDKLATLDIHELINHAFEGIVAKRARFEPFCHRLIALPDETLISLLQKHAKQFKKAHALLDYLLNNHPRRENVIASMQNIRAFNRYFACAPRGLRTDSHTIADTVVSLKTLTGFVNGYRFFTLIGAQLPFLQAISADKMRSLFLYQPAFQIRTFFRELFEARAHAFFHHPLGLVAIETPLRMGCFLDAWEQDIDFLKSLFRGNFTFYNVLHSIHSGGLTEFLEGYCRDFPLFLEKSDFLPLSWLGKCIGRDFFAVHQRFKHHSEANRLMMWWLLERPEELCRSYTEDALFDALNRLSDKPLASWLEKASSILCSSENLGEQTAPLHFGGGIARILEARGAHPAIGRLIGQRYYRDVTAPFWAENARWIALFAWLESPDHIAEFIAMQTASSSGIKSIFSLEGLFREFMRCHATVFESISALQRFENFLRIFCKALGELKSVDDISTALLIFLYLIPAILGGVLALGVHFGAQMPLRYAFSAQLPVFFPRIPPHELLLNAQVFFAKCERLRAIPTLSSSAFFVRADTQRSAPVEADSMSNALPSVP